MTNKITATDIATATRVMRAVAMKAQAGDMRPFDTIPLYEAVMAATDAVVIEAIITNQNRSHNWLTRRPKNEPHFGANKLHVMGGTPKPGPHLQPVRFAQWMAAREMGVRIRLVAPCIARHQWKVGYDHPYGNPLSIVDVYELDGVQPSTALPNVARFETGTYPPVKHMIRGIRGRAGANHLQFLKIFHLWVENEGRPSIDLNLDR